MDPAALDPKSADQVIRHELFAWEAIAPFAHFDSNFLQQFELKGTPVKVFASSRIAAEVETGVQFVTRAISLLFLNSRLYGAFPVWSFERSGLFSVSSFRARRVDQSAKKAAKSKAIIGHLMLVKSDKPD